MIKWCALKTRSDILNCKEVVSHLSAWFNIICKKFKCLQKDIFLHWPIYLVTVIKFIETFFTCLSGNTWSVFGLQPDIWLKCLPEVTLDWRPIWTWLTLYIVLLSEDNWSDQMLFYWNIYLIKYQFEDSLVNQYIFYLPEDTWCVFILELDNCIHEKTMINTFSVY